MDDVIRNTDRIFYKHEISENLFKNTYSMHTHNTYECIFFIEGDAAHVIEDRKYELSPGDLILIRPFQYHLIQINSPTRYERYDILFDAKKHGVESVLALPEEAEVLHLAGNGIVEDLFHKCDLYRKSSDPETFEKILSHLLSELFYLIPLLPKQVSQNRETLSPLISKALRYMNEHLCTLSGIREIADALFVSESYLFRLFQKELHQTPKKYVLEKRLLLAQQMLQAKKRPSDVSEACGFSDYSSFYRNYRSFFGIAPSQNQKGDRQ